MNIFRQNKIFRYMPLSIIVFTALIYFRALFNDFANWDDDIYIIQNHLIKKFTFCNIADIFTSFYMGNYHPLAMLTFLFEYTFFGLNPFSYHLLNVLLHLLNTWLVFKFIEQLSENKITALIVSLFFAIHPMHVESVAWISELKDVLYSAFYLLSLFVYLRYIKSTNNIKLYIGSLLLFVASLLSKSASVTLPVLLLAIDFYKGRTINTKMFLEKVPFLLLSLLFGILALLSQPIEKSATDLFASYSFLQRIFIFSYTVSFYIIKIIAPFQLSVMHYLPMLKDGFLPWYYYASLPFILFIIFSLFFRFNFRKEIIFGLSFFLITVSVMLQIIPVGGSIASERYTYIPYIGLFYIAGQLFSYLKRHKLRKALFILISLFVIMFSYQTWVRIGVWKNGEVLFSDSIKKYPDIYFGYWTRGIFRNGEGNLKGALQDYNKSIGKNPVFADAYYDRGVTYSSLGDIQSALRDYNNAIKLNPAYADAYLNRGMLYDGLGKADSAMYDFNMTILLKPAFAKAYNNRAVLKAKSGDLTGALQDINKAISLMPDYAEAYSNRGNIKAIQNNHTDACEDWKKAVELGYGAASQIVNKYCN